MTSAAKKSSVFADWINPGFFWLLVAVIGAGLFFAEGIDALMAAWSLPEYSHGPLIPILSALLFLRQLKEYPADPGPKRNRWVGVTVIVAALSLAALGKMSNISDLVAYATILWIGGLLLVSFGWETGRHFWPPVLHLVYMLPLPRSHLLQDDHMASARVIRIGGLFPASSVHSGVSRRKHHRSWHHKTACG